MLVVIDESLRLSQRLSGKNTPKGIGGIKNYGDFRQQRRRSKWKRCRSAQRCAAELT